jgi:very-short-patch-repair endonuclease
MKHKIPIIPYDKDLKSLASSLRKNMTFSEVLLWNQLKNKQMLGFDFDRQRPIGNYIVDFYCKELRLAIEVDGDSHTYRYDYDDERQSNLEKLGVRFLRFDDLEIKRDINNVLSVIEKFITENQPAPDNS